MKKKITRRAFLQGCAVSSLAIGVAACDDGNGDGHEDLQDLQREDLHEVQEDTSSPPDLSPDLNQVDQNDQSHPDLPLDEAPDLGPNDIRQFESYRDLARLDYFEIDHRGRLVCVVDFAPAVDIHTHLGFSYGNAPTIDLLATSEAVNYLFNCEVEDGCPIDLDIYANKSISQSSVTDGNIEIANAVGSDEGSDAAKTHTIPNLLAEMDDLGIQRSVALAIALNHHAEHNNPSQHWLDSVNARGVGDRILTYGSIHPRKEGYEAELAGLAQAGILGVKIHPTMQLLYPDEEAAMLAYGEIASHGLPVFFHAGRTGVEMGFQGKYAVLDHYVAPVEDFPNLQFVLGHSGAIDDFEAAVALAKTHPNVWLCLAGPSIPAIEYMLDELGPEKLLFGTDWPFYAQAMQLAKVLIATEHDHAIRDLILSENAATFFATPSR